MKKLPPPPNNIGVVRNFASITGHKRTFKIVDEVWVRQTTSSTPKLIYLQKFRFLEKRRTEYRLTYYMLGQRRGARGHWVFGQYSLLVPARYLRQILRKARKKGWRL